MRIDHSVKVKLDTRRRKKDKSFPIIIRIILLGKTIDINTRLSVKEKDWSPNDPYIKKSYGDRYRVLNLKIKKQHLEIESKIDSLIKKGVLDGVLTHKEIKAKLLGNNNALIISFFDQHIAELRKANKLGTARWYKSALHAVKEFSKNKNDVAIDFPLKNITPTWLRKFDSWYLAKNNGDQSINGLSVYMRAIRALYNKAIREGLVEEGSNPFKQYKIRSKETKKRALTKEEFKAIASARCETRWQERSKAFLLASYYLYGMSFRDMCHLVVNDLKSNGRIEYRRVKTGKHLSIKINKTLSSLLEPYLKGKVGKDYIFNVLRTDQTNVQKYNAIKNAMKRCNKALRELAEKSGIDQISTYSARHSFASHLLKNGQSIEVISQMMGHKSIRTTQVYLKGFNTDVLDEAQEGLVSLL